MDVEVGGRWKVAAPGSKDGLHWEGREGAAGEVMRPESAGTRQKKAGENSEGEEESLGAQKAHSVL